MRSLLLAAVLAMPAGAQAPMSAAAPAAGPLINLSLMEALVAIGAQDLVGLFAYVPENAASSAMADYLFHNRDKLKKFLKKAKKDMKETNGINEWDREVFMIMMQTNTQPLPPEIEKLSRKEELGISACVLAQPLTLGQLNSLRKR